MVSQNQLTLPPYRLIEMNINPPPFVGIGTLLFADILGPTEQRDVSPSEMLDVMGRHLQYVSEIIEGHSGVVYQFIGSAVAAYWHPSCINPSHAQLAFDAGREMIESLPVLMTKQKGLTYEVDILLGTGQMSGDAFGPIKQFQVIGMAMAIVDRISRSPRTSGASSIRMSQYTADLIDARGELEESIRIARNNLDDLQVFSYRPSSIIA